MTSYLMTSIAGAGIFTNLSGFPIMASAEMGQHGPATPQRPTTSKIDRTLDNWREVPDHSMRALRDMGRRFR